MSVECQDPAIPARISDPPPDASSSPPSPALCLFPSVAEPPLETFGLQPCYVLELLEALHAELPSTWEVRYVHGLKQFAVHLAGRTLDRWLLFAGGGVSSKALQVASTFLRDRYNIDIPVRTRVFSESDPPKREFLRIQHPDVPIMSTTCSELTRSSIINDNTDEPVVLPPCFSADGGIPCVSRTTLSKHSAKNIDCVQEKREETGLGAEMLRATTEVHMPEIGDAECVTGLFARSAPGKRSDAEYIVESYNALSYWSIGLQVEAQDWASFVARLRGWWGWARGLTGSDADKDAYFVGLLNAFKLKDVHPRPERYLCMTRRERQVVSEAIGVPLWEDYGPRESRSVKEENLSWKSEHRSLFLENGLHWPPVGDVWERTNSVILISELLPREREAIFFIDQLWPAAFDSQVEFLDINPTLTRVAGSCLEGRLGPRKEGLSPWKANAPTQVGSGKMVVRHEIPAEEQAQYGDFQTHLIRVIEAFEAMRMVGWSDQFWHPDTPRLFSGRDEPAHLERICNIAGNSYSVYHLIPWTLTKWSLVGTFLPSTGDAVATDYDVAPPGFKHYSDVAYEGAFDRPAYGVLLDTHRRATVAGQPGVLVPEDTAVDPDQEIDVVSSLSEPDSD